MYEQLKTLINSLKIDNFRILVREINKYKYKTKNVNIVDGPYDGGNDLEIIIDDKDIKKNIQITVQKTGFEKKIFSDLQKAKNNIDKYSYMKNFDFYISQSVSKENKNSLSLKSEVEYDINLNIIDANTIAQIIESNSELNSLLYQFHNIEDNRDKFFDKNTKIIFDVLTHNKNTVEIKRNFISSHIFSFLLTNPISTLEELTDYIFNVFESKIERAYIEREINNLRLKQIIKGNKIEKTIYLSDEKRNEIQKIYDIVSIEENLFIEKINSFLQKENLDIELKDLIELLYKIYKENYNIDIEELTENSNSYTSSLKKSLTDLKNFLTSKNLDQDQADAISDKLINICGESEFLSKYSTVHLFNNLFNSNKLEKYLDSKEQKVFIDTQILLRLLCVIYPTSEYKFIDSALNSVNLFYNTSIKLKDQLYLITSNDYIEEVAIHIANAIKLKRFMDLPFMQNIGTTKNVFYNAFLEYRNTSLLDSQTTFSEFLAELLDLDIFDLENKNHDDLVQVIGNKVFETLEYLGIEIITHNLYPNFQAIKKEYEIHLALSSKERAFNAIQNDLRTILYLSTRDYHYNESGVYEEPYLLTWDSSFYYIRKILMNQKQKINASFWYIYSPLKLVDRLSVMNFNLNPEMLNLNIIALTENNFNYSSKKASFIDVISTFFNKSDVSQLGIIKKISKLSTETKDLNIDEENAKEFSESEEESPILKTLLEIRNHFSSGNSKYSFNVIFPKNRTV